ncbi:MAG: hypothetical protein HGB00_04995 [Chlorobiaceae bacterium]|nr:hypothetical protein [Chlorobiaceae bacterium]
MKWPLRILFILLLSVVATAAGAWFAFPWYAQALIDRAIGQDISLKVHDLGRPGTDGLKFGRVDAVFTTKPDTCTGIASTFRGTVYNGSISWRRIPGAASFLAGVELKADSLKVLQEPAGITLSDRNPSIKAHVQIGRRSWLIPDFVPESVDYSIEDAVAENGTLSLAGVSYKVHLTKNGNWIQQPSRFKALSLFSAGAKTPLTGMEATVGMERTPDKPCALIFSDCSLSMAGLRASTPLIEYCLKKRRTSFTLNIDTLQLDSMAATTGLQKSNPGFTGNLSGSIPIEYVDSTVRIRNGIVKSGKGTRLTFRKTDGRPSASFDASQASNGSAMIGNLNAVVSLAGNDRQSTSVTLKEFSMKLFGGSVTALNVSSPAPGRNSFTLRLTDLPILDRIRLHEDFKASMKGSISGTVPISIDTKGMTISNAHINSKGGGTIRQSLPLSKLDAESAFRPATQEVSWSFSEPSIVLNLDSGGKTSIGFHLRSLGRKTGDGELMLTNPEGTIGLMEHRNNPSTISLSKFSSGLMSGSLAIDHVDYDLKSRHAETVLLLNGIPLQKLLELQGTEKIHATGNLRGRIPVVMDGAGFRIPDGGMNAEKTGQIIYSSTPEERSVANPGMRITYEALGNFFYSELVSSITMSPDGNSLITLQIKGHNPDFQNGRPVNLNLNIEQNLLELMRSLSIASGIEQQILEKATRAGKKQK